MINRSNPKHIILAALMGGCFFLYACENDLRTVQQVNKKKTGVEEAKNIESYLSQEAKLKAKLTAPLMLRYQTDTPRIVFPNSLHVDFFDSTKAIETELYAKFGKYTEGDGKVFLKDSVRVYNAKGDTLVTEELWWDQTQNIFYTVQPVEIRKPQQKFLAKDGMRASQDLKNITLFTMQPGSIINLPDSTF